MSSSNILANRDANLPLASATNNNNSGGPASEGKDVKSMEYHRQVLQSKMEEEKQKQQYISPSDNIMSPCTAKLNALRSKHAGKAKPKSLFAQTSSKKLEGDALFGSKSVVKDAEK